jgi:DNA transformation protein
MANPASFVEHVTDLFSPLGDVALRRMFGGHGLLCDGLMFGLLDDGELFLRTDELCEQAFVAAGGTRWIYPSRKGPMETRYLQSPAVAMEDPEPMREWFKLSFEAARRKRREGGAKTDGEGEAAADDIRASDQELAQAFCEAGEARQQADTPAVEGGPRRSQAVEGGPRRSQSDAAVRDGRMGRRTTNRSVGGRFGATFRRYGLDS